MSDWILGLKKAASAWMPGVGAGDIRQVEAQAGEAFPDELRALYLQLDGANFENGVALFPLRKREREGVLEPGEPVQGLPARGIWRFGVRGEGEPLFAARKGPLFEAAQGAVFPEWFESVPDDAWVFGLKGAHGELYLHRTLRQLLTELVPPAETEEFGEMTFVRALQAVGSALEEALLEAAEQATARPSGGGAAPAPAEAASAPVAEPKPERPRRRVAKAGAKRSGATAKKAAKPAKKAAVKPAKKAAKPKKAKPSSSGRGALAKKAAARAPKSAGRASARKAPARKTPAKRPSRRR